MLRQRVITAIVLLAILAGALAAPSAWPLLLFLSLACACACWEWLRLTTRAPSWLAALVGSILFFLSAYQSNIWVTASHEAAVAVKTLVLLTSLAWCTLALASVIKGDTDVPASSVTWSIFGVITLATAWCCLALLFLQRGALYLFSLLVVIWIADIAAYFGGKAYGRRKLAIRISPGKTLEGALFGIVGVLTWILVSAQWANTFAAELVRIWGLWSTVFIAIALAVMSIVGDLFESLLKRRAAVKDSSNLLPGHGGVLDRIDAVIAVVPLAFMLTEFR